MYEIIIFAIVLYLIITNSFIRLQIQRDGVFLIFKRKEYTYDLEEGKYKEEIVISIRRLI
tara:strand:- start:129 stop:308 length:180 start_codon:yes stop_codon:yes gene_type:complete